MNYSSENRIKFTIDIVQYIVTSWYNNLKIKYPKILHNFGTNEVRNIK